MRDLTTDPTDPHHPNVAAIIARLALPTAVLTARGHVEYANTRFAELFDPQAPGIEGFDFAALLDPDDHSALQNLVSETAEPETVPSDIPVRVPSFAGEIRSATLSRLIDQSGFWGFLCQVSDDDTASSSTLRYVMEHLDQGVWDYDARTNFFVVSDAWRRMRGLSPDDQINVPNDEWLQDVHPEDRERLRERMIESRHKRDAQDPERVARGDGGASGHHRRGEPPARRPPGSAPASTRDCRRRPNRR